MQRRPYFPMNTAWKQSDPPHTNNLMKTCLVTLYRQPTRRKFGSLCVNAEFKFFKLSWLLAALETRMLKSSFLHDQSFMHTDVNYTHCSPFSHFCSIVLCFQIRSILAKNRRKFCFVILWIQFMKTRPVLIGCIWRNCDHFFHGCLSSS